jgi:hypothetical protein
MSEHVCILHCVVSYLFPGQSEPPCAGTGLSHDLDRVNVPLSHVLEHVLHSPHIPQIPFTMTNKRYMWYIRIDIKQYHYNVDLLLVITIRLILS